MPAASGRGVANAEELFRSKRIGKIQKTEGITRREICAKEELRQLVSRSYTTRLATAAPCQVPDYQVDPDKHIWGRLDEGMLLEAHASGADGGAVLALSSRLPPLHLHTAGMEVDWMGDTARSISCTTCAGHCAALPHH